MIKISPVLLRVLVCSLFGLYLMNQGIQMIYDGNVFTSMYGFAMTGIGALIIITGVQPSKAAQVIKAITKIITTSFK
jgi:hypothetical protein